MLNLSEHRIAVTGGSGFLGSHVVAALRRRGCKDPIVPRKAEYDLTLEADVRRFYAQKRPDLVIHLAAVVGGIGANRENPGRFFYENLMMGALTMEHARLAGVRKYVSDWNNLLLSQIYAGPFSRRRAVERLSRRNECSLRAREENAAGAGAGVPAAVRLQRRLSPSR